MKKGSKKNQAIEQTPATPGELMTLEGTKSVEIKEEVSQDSILEIEEIKKEEPSVFKPVTPAEATSVFKEVLPEVDSNKVKQSAEGTKEASVFEAVKKETLPVVKLIYQLTYYNDKEEEFTYFTEKQPEFKEVSGFFGLVAKDCFRKYTLNENILGRKVIKVNYKGKNKIKELTIDLINGVVVKVVEEAKWMKIEQDRAEKLFNERVLQEYRTITKEAGLNNTELEKF